MSIFEKPGEVLFNFAHLSCGAMDKIKSIGYYDAPASKGHHLAVKGGLAAHSLNVTRRLIDISDALGQCYRLNPDGKTYSYVQPKWPGHGTASVMIATVELGIQLNPDEAAAITYHMGAFGLTGRAHDEFDAALDAFPGPIIATHTADWSAARLDESGDWSSERTAHP